MAFVLVGQGLCGTSQASFSRESLANGALLIKWAANLLRGCAKDSIGLNRVSTHEYMENQQK